MTERPTSSDNVVDNDDPLTLFDGIRLNLEKVFAVFLLVASRDDLAWQLSSLAHGHEPRAELEREAGTE